MFDPPSDRYPKKWSEMSLDYRLMFGYHGCMMLLFIAGEGLSIVQEGCAAALLAALIFAVAVRNRRLKNWAWPKLTTGKVVAAILAAVAITFFLYSATSIFPPSDHRILPWYLAGLGIGVFGVLTSLGVVDASEAEFASHCLSLDENGQAVGPTSQSTDSKTSEPTWKRAVRAVYSICFTLIWIGGVLSFVIYGNGVRAGSLEPTASRTEAINEHGKLVYVTPQEKRKIDSFQFVSSVGVPIIVLGGFGLHFLLGVKLFPNAPTLAEYLARRHARKSIPPPPKPC